jgi:hypothetical protein
MWAETTDSARSITTCHAYPLTLAEIGALEDWHRFCSAKGLTYNRVHDYEASSQSGQMEVTSAFRASSVPLSCPVARIRQAASDADHLPGARPIRHRVDPLHHRLGRG